MTPPFEQRLDLRAPCDKHFSEADFLGVRECEYSVRNTSRQGSLLAIQGVSWIGGPMRRSAGPLDSIGRMHQGTTT